MKTRPSVVEIHHIGTDYAQLRVDVPATHLHGVTRAISTALERGTDVDRQAQQEREAARRDANRFRQRNSTVQAAAPTAGTEKHTQPEVNVTNGVAIRELVERTAPAVIRITGGDLCAAFGSVAPIDIPCGRPDCPCTDESAPDAEFDGPDCGDGAEGLEGGDA